VLDITIDELALRSGTTTRNIRAFQSTGVLAFPHIVGRTAHYGEAHLERLERVMHLQRSGFSLAAIRALFDALEAGRTLAEVLGVVGSSRTDRGESCPPDLFGDLAGGSGRALRLLSVLPSNLLEGFPLGALDVLP
jgi:DNA-binding transcriptional MerR regulator